jgi:hypothetical protein
MLLVGGNDFADTEVLFAVHFKLCHINFALVFVKPAWVLDSVSAVDDNKSILFC